MKGKILVKTLGLGIITLVFSALFWYAAKKATELPLSWEPSTQWGILLTLLFFVIFLALLAIFCMLIESLPFLLSALFVFSLPYFLFFSFDIYALIIILLLTLSFWYFAFSIRKEIKARLKFSPLKVAHFGLKFILLASLVSLSLSYYGLMVKKGNTPEVVLNNVVKTTHQLVLDIFEKKLKGFRPEMTLDEFITSFSPEELFSIIPQGFLPGDFQKEFFKNLGVPEGELEQLSDSPSASEIGKELSEEMEKQIQKEFGQQIKEALNKQLGIKLSGSETVSEILFNLISKEADKNLGSFKNYIPSILSFGLFLILVTFLWLYALLTKLFISLFMAILFLTRFVKVEKEVKPAEVLSLE